MFLELEDFSDFTLSISRTRLSWRLSSSRVLVKHLQGLEDIENISHYFKFTEKKSILMENLS